MSGREIEILVPCGQVLLLGMFGMSLIQAMCGLHSLELPFERLVVGMIALWLYPMAALWLDGFSDQLAAGISEIGHGQDLKALLLSALSKAAATPPSGGGSTSFNIPATLEQVWRTGVWGVMSALVEGVFLVISFVLECAREVLWQVVLFLFPLVAGCYPIFPRLMGGMISYAVELSLWSPLLCLIERVTGQVAKGHLTEVGSLGLSVVGVELVAIVLILSIPALAHGFISGVLSGDHSSQRTALGWIRTIVIENRMKPARIPTEGTS